MFPIIVIKERRIKMNIVVFDTETVSIDKPFCYNVGFVIYNTDLNKIIEKREYCIEQVWHNSMLFATAYFSDKRPIYINRMRAKKIKLEKWGKVTQEMIRLFKFYNVEFAYAYNSPFDDRVFSFNSEWYKTINPFDNIKIIDIAGLVHNKIAFDMGYKMFCDTYKLYTESGNYSTTAENVYRFINNNEDFIEEHTALADSEIELEILLYCVNKGCAFGKEYKKYNSIPREKTLTIIDKRTDTPTETKYNYKSIRISKDKTKITIK